MFVNEDMDLFHNVKFKHVQGAAPVLRLLNKDEETVERIPMKDLSREECNDLLLSKGFYKKSSKDEEVPEEFKEGPYAPKDEL